MKLILILIVYLILYPLKSLKIKELKFFFLISLILYILEFLLIFKLSFSLLKIIFLLILLISFIDFIAFSIFNINLQIPYLYSYIIVKSPEAKIKFALSKIFILFIINIYLLIKTQTLLFSKELVSIYVKSNRKKEKFDEVIINL